MGIVNVTPDSFADGGATSDPGLAADRALALEASGADVLDVGGESTRPGAEPVAAREELRRILPVIDRLVGSARVPISVDTYKAEVAEAALDHGASMVNDVSGLAAGPALAAAAARAGAPLVLMHNRGSSRDMYARAGYRDAGAEVLAELRAIVDRAVTAGAPREQIVIDPGLGFAKRADATFAVLAGLPALRSLDLPILVGPSRKSFLTAVLGDRRPDEREWGTAAAVTTAVCLGAHIVRVHRVGAHIDVVRVADAIRTAAGAAESDSVASAVPHVTGAPR
jgi:dihydropteroate synthase